MLTHRLLLLRTARKLSRGGFTLVELLVVIGIIAILAGVALGPITNGIKKAAQSSGVQTSRTIAVAEFQYANDNSQTYPDGSGTAAVVAQALAKGGYVGDPGIFYINGSKEAKYTGTSPSTGLAQNNISWDFVSTSGTGAISNAPDQLPLVWSCVGASVNLSGTGPIATPTLTASMPFGTAGVAVAYKSNSAKFISLPSGAPNLADPSYPSYSTATGSLLGGG